MLKHEIIPYLIILLKTADLLEQWTEQTLGTLLNKQGPAWDALCNL